MSDTVNSPEINGVTSSIIRASASVKLSASTKYGSVTFFLHPVFHYFLVANFT